MEVIFCWLLLLLAGIYSLWLRTTRYRQEMSVDTKVSPISLALQDLIAVAGGIYLSLVMLVSFLKIALPERIFIFSVALDPLAFIAVCLGIIQPLISNLLKKVK